MTLKKSSVLCLMTLVGQLFMQGLVQMARLLFPTSEASAGRLRLVQEAPEGCSVTRLAVNVGWGPRWSCQQQRLHGTSLCGLGFLTREIMSPEQLFLERKSTS